MKDYLRLLQYARPLSRFAALYLLLSLAHSIFGVVNFALLIPLLDVLFNTVDHAKMEAVLAKPVPSFSWDIGYLEQIFYYYFGLTLKEKGSMGALHFVCIVVVCSVFLSNFFGYLRTRQSEALKTRVVERIRREVFRKITSLHVDYFAHIRKGDIISRSTTDVYELEGSITHTFTMIMQEPIMIAIYFVALFNISTELTLFALVVVPVLSLGVSLVVRRLRRAATEVQDSQGNIISQLDEAIDGMRIAKAFNALGYVWGKFDQENSRYSQLLRRYSFRRGMASPVSEFLGVLVVTLILIYGGNMVLNGGENAITGANFVAYLIMFSQVTRPMKSMSNAWTSVQRGLASGRRIFQLLDTEIPIVEKPNALPLKTIEKGLSFEQVEFAYEVDPAQPREMVLKGISFEVKKGQTVALVGPSGAGKSTIADLIPRFYDVLGGRIAIDGIDIRDFRLDDLHRQLAIVTQESILFNDTIFNNIAFGRPDANMEEVMEAAKVANAHNFIMATEHGYQTTVGDRGMKLSGGQKQRISIARAVFKNPPLLLLDEATSALDTESEKLVQEALEKLMAHRTSVVIAHRLSTIQHADLILVLDKGQVVEKGTHQELLQQEGGLYQKLNAMQATF